MRYRKNRCMRENMRARVAGNRNREKEQPSAGFGFSGWLKATPVATGTFSQGKHRFRGRGSIFAGSSTYFVAGAALLQGQVQISWQAQHFRKVRYRFRGRGSILQGQVQISWQAQQFRKVRYRFRGRRNTFVIEGTSIISSCSSKIAKVKYKSCIRSRLLQLQLENRKSQVQK